ncbi:MAG: hypothetical protein J2P17_33860, partial [Mycobacterium sp.]|nr:hypothetical protein [Mycobacterium sp.]
LTKGGNDVEYSTVFKACAFAAPFSDCLDSDFYLTRGNGRLDPQPLRDYEPRIIDLAASKLRATYLRILQLAPNARVVVLGYPRFFPAAENRIAECRYGNTSTRDLDWFNQMADRLNGNIAGVVNDLQRAGNNIRYVDANQLFESHRFCELRGGGEYLHNIDPTDIIVGQQNGWFHPNIAGLDAYAAMVQTGMG